MITPHEKNILTIFTPTYNRAHLLPKLYNSLLSSSNKNFIWLIIDDASTDSTEELVNAWINEKKLQIKYYKQSHGGKMAAFNYAVTKAHTDLFITIDSDDTIHPNAVEIINTYYTQDIDLFKNGTCVGYIAYNSPIDKDFQKFPISNTDQLHNFFELKTTYKYRGESIWIKYVPELKKIIVPYFKNELFLMDDAHHFIYSHTNNIKIIPQILGYYEYQSDGLTKSNSDKLIANSPKGYALYLYLYCNLIQKKLLRIRYMAKFMGICNAYNIAPQEIISHVAIKDIRYNISLSEELLAKLYSLNYTKKFSRLRKTYAQ